MAIIVISAPQVIATGIMDRITGQTIRDQEIMEITIGAVDHPTIVTTTTIETIPIKAEMMTPGTTTATILGQTITTTVATTIRVATMTRGIKTAMALVITTTTTTGITKGAATMMIGVTAAVPIKIHDPETTTATITIRERIMIRGTTIAMTLGVIVTPKVTIIKVAVTIMTGATAVVPTKIRAPEIIRTTKTTTAMMDGTAAAQIEMQEIMEMAVSLTLFISLKPFEQY